MFCCNNDNRTKFFFFFFFSCFSPSSKFFLPPIRQPYCDLRWLICTYSIRICSYTVQIDFSPWGSLFRFWCFLNLLALSCCGCAFQETNIQQCLFGVIQCDITEQGKLNASRCTCFKKSNVNAQKKREFVTCFCSRYVNLSTQQIRR